MENIKEYAVVAVSSEDADSLHEDLIRQTNINYIPDRSVDIADYRPLSPRITHYALSEEEAIKLQHDPRVFSVEVPPHLNPDVIFKNNTRQQATFSKLFLTTADDVNWGLARCNFNDDPWTAAGNQINYTGSYDYTLTGKGVDVVIQDSGIDPTHPDFFDDNGVSRVQQIDWYAASGIAGSMSANHYLDYDGHGTHVASTVAGRLMGWARNARIYSVKSAGLAGSEGGGIAETNIFDVIRLWHINKQPDPATGLKRPTVVNMSWGTYATENSSNLPASIQWRGGNYLRGTNYSTLNEMQTNYGWMGFQSGPSNFYYHSFYSPTYQSEVLDMINAGIHVVVAAGNGNVKIDTAQGLDYNNTWGGYGNAQYHRGGCPGALHAIVVGSIDTGYQSSLERRSSFSEQGPGVTVYAPGGYIMGASSSSNAGTNSIASSGYTNVAYPGYPTFNLMKISGTSMASPQVCGVLACMLEANPSYTPDQAKQWIINNSTKGLLFDTGSGTSYNTAYSLVGGNNRILFNPFNKSNSGTLTGRAKIFNGALSLK